MQNEPASPLGNDDEYVSDFDYHEAPIPEGARRARLVDGKSSMEGYVLDEHFYVQDVVSNGTSRAALVGAPPQYDPIPLTRIRENKHELELL